MNYLILGANAAGMSAAVRILKSDKNANITVLEKGDVVSFGSCGIPYFVAGEFDDVNQLTARPLEEFTKLGIDVRQFHTVTAIDTDKKQVTVNQSQVFDYDKLLIAVGASPTIPPIKGINSSICQTMHSRQDAITLLNLLPTCQNIVIIGAGFIGLEAAEAFVERGKHVTIIEFLDRALARTYDTEITTLIEEALHRNGVRLKLNEKVMEVTNNSVITDKGEYAADLVIVATGFKPNTEFLRDTKIKLSKEGAVIIDDQCKTNLPDIFSAGDCATVPHKISGDAYIPLATSANKLGRIAGEVMAGNDTRRFIGTLGSSGIRVFDMEAGRTGVSEAEAKQLGINYATVFIKDKNHADSVAGQTDIWIKLIFDKQSRKLLGGQIFGSYTGGAVYRVNALAVAVYSGLTVEELGYMDFIYAPPFARTWDALNVAGNVAR
jgi:NADPH-dependent 2,4-dienoyl-CoA reductase/sulfur reductase-like enzyme